MELILTTQSPSVFTVALSSRVIVVGALIVERKLYTLISDIHSDQTDRRLYKIGRVDARRMHFRRIYSGPNNTTLDSDWTSIKCKIYHTALQIIHVSSVLPSLENSRRNLYALRCSHSSTTNVVD